MNPATMTPAELVFLQEQLNASRHYLEFGAGSSTQMAVGTPQLTTIDSVESSLPFLEQHVLSTPAVAQARDSGRLRLHVVDIGPTADWGTPTDPSKKHLWPNYSSQIFREQNNWDLVLIDGRFRVACCLNALLHTNPGTRIMIHDFWVRPEYQVILPFVEVVKKVDTFGLFQKKSTADLTQLKTVLEKYQYLPWDKEPRLAGLKNFLRSHLLTNPK